MMRKESLGVYSDFPEEGCHTFSLELSLPPISFQRALVNALYKLNGCSVKNYWSKIIGANMDVIFEFGVAEDLTFHYIDADILNLLLKTINCGRIRVLDFICIIRYYVEGGIGKRRKPLRFDYYFLRFFFSGRHLEIKVFHEKGVQRISANEVVEFLMGYVKLSLGGERSNHHS